MAPQLLFSKCFHAIAVFIFRNTALALLISSLKDGEIEAKRLNACQNEGYIPL